MIFQKHKHKTPWLIGLIYNTTMKKMLVQTITLLLIFYLLAGCYLFFFQRNFLYHPTPAISHNYPIHRFTDHTARIDTLILSPDQSNAIIYFGGNAESAAKIAPDFAQNFKNHTVYLMNYRGFGSSTGAASEQALYQDAITLFDQIKHKHKNISLIGRSLGSGLAAYVAAKRETHKLILITPYDSILNVARSKYPIYPIGLMLHDQFNTAKLVPQIQEPTLAILAEKDRIVPLAHAYALINHFPKTQISSIQLVQSNHNNISTHRHYFS